MKIIFILLTLIVIINYLYNFVYYISANKAYKNKKKGKEIDKGNFYLLLPVYHEEEIAEEMVDRFYKLSTSSNVKTIIITTIKEKDNKTHEIIENKIKNDQMEDYITLIKCDIEDGTMATQLNYAIDYIDSIDKSDYIIGIHNADGAISDEHIEFARRNVDENTCVQSYAYFKNNNGVLLNGPVAWQNRWSYLFEAGRCGLKSGKRALFRKMNYVIGHGLYMKASSIKECGYFPEDTINEDAFLGVILNYKDKKLVPMPYLERADFAPKIKIYIKQQSVWFNGPRMAFSYFKRIVSNKKNKRYERNVFEDSISNRIKLLIICFKLFLHAVYWISAVYVLFVLYGFVSYKLFGLLGFLYVYLINYINLVGFNYLSYRRIKKETGSDIDFPILQLPIIFYFIHSFGPVINVFKTITGKNTIKNKYKTER